MSQEKVPEEKLFLIERQTVLMLLVQIRKYAKNIEFFQDTKHRLIFSCIILYQKQMYVGFNYVLLT